MSVSRRLGVAEFQPAEYQRNVFVIAPEQGTTLDDIKKPEYWSHVASRLRAWDRIEVRGTDGGFYAELLVRAVQPFSALVHVLSHFDFDQAEAESREPVDAGGYKLEWRGPRAKWSVRRLSDGVFVHESAESKQAAASWLNDHLRKLAA